MKKNKKIKIFSFLALLSIGVLLTPTIISCSSVSAKNENNKPESPNLNQPTLRGVNIYPKNNDYNYDVDDTIMINSSLVGEHLNNQSITYQWYVRENSSDIFKPIGDNSSTLKIKATMSLNESTFKVDASLNSKTYTSNQLTIRVNDVTSPTPPPTNPVLRSIQISTDKTNYNENENISITSTVYGDNLNDKNLTYQWYIKKASGSFEILSGQTNKNLNINATREYNDSTFKLKVSLDSQSIDSNIISITVTNPSTPTPPEPVPPPVEEPDFYITTQSNRVNIGQGITFNAIFKNTVPSTNIEWFIKKTNNDWTKIQSTTNEVLNFIISDDTYNDARIKANTTINGQKTGSNEITIIVDAQNYVPPVEPNYPDVPPLTPPSIPNGSVSTRKFPHDASKNLIKSFKVNGVPQEIVKINEFGPEFTVFIDESKDYKIEVELNTDYKDYGVNMGFKNPTVSFYKTIFNSGTKILDDGNYNKIVDINKLSVDRPTHFVQATGIIQEEGYQSQEFNVGIRLRNKYIPQLVEGEDYFKFENMLITNPYTQNEALKNKYGNVPLPIAINGEFIDPLAEVSKEDLFRMFHLIVSQRWTPKMNFGSRRIWSEFFVDTFIEWLVKNWKYYPELNFNNPRLYFTTNYPHWFFDQYRLNDINADPKDGVDLTFHGYEKLVKNQYSGKGPNIEEYMKKHYQAKDIYMTEIMSFNVASRMSYSSRDQDKFFEGVSLFFSNYIRPGMSDKDKVFAVYMFVSDWLRYQGNSSHDAYGFWSNHVGVCANYGGIAAYLLNLLDVPAIPILTGDVDDNPKRMLHMNTWIYMDADGTGDKQWYMQDSTWTDYTWGEGSTWPSMRFKGKGDGDPNTFKLLLTDVYKQKYGDYDYNPETWSGLEYLLYHNNFFGFFGAQWFRPYLQNEISYGSYNIKQESWMVNQYDNNLLPKPAFHNGYWYFFDSNNRFVKTKITGEYEEATDLSSSIPDWVKDKLAKKYGSITMAQFGKYVFISNSSYNSYHNAFKHPEDKWFIVHDLDDTNWKKSKLISFNSDMPVEFSGGSIPIKDAALLTYFFDENKMLNLELQGPGPCTNSSNWKESKIFKFNIFEMFSEELAGLDIGKLETTNKVENGVKIDGDDTIAYSYYTAMGNGIGILPNKDTNITPEQKQQYNAGLKNILNNGLLSANDKAIKMKQLFDDLIKSSQKVEISDTLIKRPSRNIYQLETKYFNELYGILFDLEDGFESLDALGTEEIAGSVRYNIWYSPTEDGQFKLLAKNLYEPRIVKEYYEKNHNPSGYYYVQYYTLKNPNNYKYTEKIKVEVEESMFGNLPLLPEFEIWKYDPSVGATLKHSSVSSNYTKFNPQWSHLPYKLRLKWKNVYFSQIDYEKIDVNLHYINKKGIVKTEKIQTITEKNQNIDLTKDLGLINSSNSGAYFMDFAYHKKTGEVFHLYTRVLYMLEFNDVVKNNINEYKKISDKIIELSRS